MWSTERPGQSFGLGATGCRVVDESVCDADAHFRIGWSALSEIAFDSVRVEFRAQAGRVPYSGIMTCLSVLARESWSNYDTHSSMRSLK